jgi:hypothetical protein
MRHFISLLSLATVAGISLIFHTTPASASDSENGVPLTISLENGQVSLEHLAIRLHGRDVTIRTELNNDTATPQAVAFYAYTSLFSQLGEGEEYFDKSFTDLRVSIQGRPRQTRKTYKSYFLGRDITDNLLKAGLNPLPDFRANPRKMARLPLIEGFKPTAWQGSVMYSWTDRMAPGTKVVQEIHYVDLPQFSLEDVESPRFSQRVQQYCGDPESVRLKIKTSDPHSSQVMIERHDFLLPYVALREVLVEVTQPERNWMGAHPIITLMCGVENPNSIAKLSGLLDAADQSLQIMTISIINNATTQKATKNSANENE